jgi:ERF superfamily
VVKDAPASATSAPHIHEAMVAIAGDLSKTGIAKDRRNEQQNFRFRGIDDVMNAVSPTFAKHGVVFLPVYTDYPDVERITGKGTTLIYAKVKGDFTYVSAKDGSSVTVTTFGTAMDSGDKATNKAMSAALKYALLQTFLIPTESSEDADASTPEPTVPKPPAGFEEWFTDLVGVSAEGFDAIKVAWRDSRPELRDYAMKFRTTEWDAIKKAAAVVTKKKAETH